MHDPDVVAFTIRRPWPQLDRSGFHDRSRWWKFSGPFWTVAGLRLYWPSFITVWHHEPGGADSGEVCKHYRRWQGPDGKWQSEVLHAWRWHVTHWQVQVHPLQALRRWVLTRCAWCGGPSRGRDKANISHQWDRDPTPWWRGEPDLYHLDCSSVEHAHRCCTCDEPKPKHRTWGECLRCGLHSTGDRPAERLASLRILKTIPRGQRNAMAFDASCRVLKQAKS